MKNLLNKVLTFMIVLSALFIVPFSVCASPPSISIDNEFSCQFELVENVCDPVNSSIEKEEIESNDKVFTIENMCDCVISSEVYAKKSFTQFDTLESYHFSSSGLLHFLTHWESYDSGHIFDFNSSGQVNTSDLLRVIEGYNYPLNYEIDVCEIDILFENSHGWQASYPGTYYAIVHTSPQDEEGGGDVENCPLSTFWVELLYGTQNPLDSTVIYYFRNSAIS